MSPELSNLVIMESKHMKSFEEAVRTARRYECVSVTESKSAGFNKKNEAEWTLHNSLRFARIYPAGSRINSSNYHPQEHWNTGCQIVALNWQSSETYELRLNKGFFLQNGNCGYILKPPYLLMPGATGMPAMEIKITVMSGHGLPKPNLETKGEVVDPYVKIFLEGPDCDPTKDAKKTGVVEDNGWHPHFEGTSASGGDKPPFVFKAIKPELTTLVVQVYDEDGTTDDFLAECFVPLPMLRSGLRTFPLKNIHSTPLNASFVLARVEIS